MSLQAALECNLKSLKMITMLKNYSVEATRSLEDNCSYEQYLYNLTGQEVSERHDKRVKNLIKSANFPTIKTLDSFDFKQIHLSKESFLEIAQGNFLANYTNVIMFGQSGSGKTHLALAIGRELCIKGKKVIFYTGCSIVQELVKAKNNLALTNYFKRLNAYDLVIIDELGYIPFEKQEADLLFQFISDRYEKKSLMITTNLAFSEWIKVFKDELVTAATIDRLIHYSVVFEFRKETSYRADQAKKKLKK
jgi:DNA replication protein DnaC